MASTTEATQPQSTVVLGIAAALSVVLIWTAWLISTRMSVGTVLGTLDLSLLRYVIPAIVLAPALRRIGIWPRNVPKIPLVLMVIGSGAPFFQVAAYGMHTTPASAAGVLLPGFMPFATAMIGMVFLGERPDAMRKLGLAAIFGGGLLLLLANTDGSLSWANFIILPMGGTLWAIYTHAFRRSGLNAFEGGALIAVWSTIINIALIPFQGVHLFSAPIADVSLQFLTQAVLSGLLATIFYGTAIRILGGTQAAAYTAVTPVAAAIGGAVLLGEALGPLTIAAAVITGVGVLLSTGILSGRR